MRRHISYNILCFSEISVLNVNFESLYKMQHYVVSDLGLYCLHMTLSGMLVNDKMAVKELYVLEILE